MRRIATLLQNIDRRVIYLLVLLSLLTPLIANFSLRPAPMETASSFFTTVEKLDPAATKLVLVAMDWGPSTQAENGSQTEVLLEHLMRRNIHFGLISLSPTAGPLLESVPKKVIAKMTAENPEFRWNYGEDWVNFGFQPNAGIMIQNMARSTDLRATLETDALGTDLKDLAVMNGVNTIRDIPILVEFTGLVGVFNTWLQFLQAENYRPQMLHGCTSITIPEAYIYYASKQILGLHEGLAGAAAYEQLLSERYPSRLIGRALKLNTSLAIAQLMIIALIVVGNIGYALSLSLQKNGASRG